MCWCVRVRVHVCVCACVCVRVCACACVEGGGGTHTGLLYLPLFLLMYLPLYLPDALIVVPAAQSTKPEATSATPRLRMRALYTCSLADLHAEQSGNQLQYVEGDVIEDVLDSGGEWLFGRLNGKEGYFLRNWTEPVQHT